ncbi:hypothetical protein K474DRAFT_1725638, partial [Panus rudis PR-1116 ss-1]
MLDFVYMVPKLMIQLREAVFNERFSRSNTTASGYNHTYLDSTSVSIANLRVFPSDHVIQNAASIAHQEAVSIFAMLGIASASLAPSKQPWFNNTVTCELPPDGHNKENDDDGCINSEDDDMDGDSDMGMDSDSDDDDDDENIAEADVLDDLFTAVEKMEVRSERDENRLMKLTCAAISFSVNGTIDINKLPEIDANELQEELTDAALRISEMVEQASATNHPSRKRKRSDSVTSGSSSQSDDMASDSEMELETLVSLRTAHQTRHAASGVRVRMETPGQSEGEHEGAATKQKLLRKFYDVIKSAQAKPVGSGLERASRWIASKTTSGATTTGNAANAAAAASSRDNEVIRSRRKAYQTSTLKNIPILQEAGISKVAPLRGETGMGSATTHGTSHIFVLVDKQVKLARVLSVYKRSGGKTGKHQWTPNVTSIGSVSYLSVQLYDHVVGCTFCAIPLQQYPRGRKKQYAHLSQQAVLCALDSLPVLHDSDLKVSKSDYRRFVQLMDSLNELQVVAKVLGPRRGKRGKKKAMDLELNDSEDDGQSR